MDQEGGADKCKPCPPCDKDAKTKSKRKAPAHAKLQTKKLLK